MEDGGILFSLLPLDCLFAAHAERVWRESELLAKHTLLAVMTFPKELFYPAASKQVAGIYIRKGFPHPASQAVFWARVVEDGHVKVKKKRLLASEMRPPRRCDDDMPELLPHLRNFLVHPGSVSVNEPMRWKTAPIDLTDSSLELLPEVYLDSAEPTLEDIEREMEQLTRIAASHLVRQGRETSDVDETR